MVGVVLGCFLFILVFIVYVGFVFGWLGLLVCVCCDYGVGGLL